MATSALRSASRRGWETRRTAAVADQRLDGVPGAAFSESVVKCLSRPRLAALSLGWKRLRASVAERKVRPLRSPAREIVTQCRAPAYMPTGTRLRLSR